MNFFRATLAALSLLCLACSDPGPAGRDGAAAHVEVSAEPEGARCPNGGQKVETSVGTGPVTTAYLCNGGNGQAGSSAVVSVSDEPAGTNCAHGGKKLETSVGEGPVTTSYLCNGEAGAGVLVVSEPAGAHCATGGVKLTAADGTEKYVCNGQDGANGLPGENVTATPEPPGATCPAGGMKLTGVSSTTYVCNGESPTLTVVPEPAGLSCPHGGQKVTASSPGGTTTAYVCNGATARVALSPEPPGPNCEAGGFKLVSYVDTNNNGMLDAAELSGATEQYLCNGVSPDAGPAAPSCTGPYEALQWDGSAWQCVQLNATGPSGGKARGFEVMDSWGTAWDGVERPAATWGDAKAACELVGGRLPTATEVWRVGASQASEVGTSYESNLLWTLTPWHVNGATQQHTTGRLNDAGGDSAITYAADSTKTPYRCVWPAPTTPGFKGARCYGPAGSGCFQAVGEGRRRNLDVYDRPSLTYAGATWECAFVGAHLPLSLSMAENILNGLPNGTGSWLWTADNTRYDLADVVKWTGTNPAGWNASYSNHWSWATRTNNNRYRFRCMGESSGLLPNTGAVPTDVATWGAPFTGDSTGLASHGKNLPAAKWEDAVQDCFSRGGQLPHTRDWMELIRDGLPNGAGVASNWVWSSDWSYQSYAQVVQWAGVDRDYTGYYSQYATWSALGAQAYPYRCTWYPVDTSYAGPGLCSGGQFNCYLSEKTAGGVTVRTWVDPVDRSPATWANAAKTCALEGGHLASMREYVALVRDGLPNGQGPVNWVWSSDSEGDTTTNPALAGLFKWGGGTNGTQINWNTTLGYQTWAYRDATNVYGYRCVWSNQAW